MLRGTNRRTNRPLIRICVNGMRARSFSPPSLPLPPPPPAAAATEICITVIRRGTIQHNRLDFTFSFENGIAEWGRALAHFTHRGTLSVMRERETERQSDRERGGGGGGGGGGGETHSRLRTRVQPRLEYYEL